MDTSTTSVLVRVGRHSDLARIGDLWEQLMMFHSERDRRFLTARGAREEFVRHVSKVLRMADHVVYVAEVDGYLVGFLMGRLEYGGPIFQDPNFGYITDACVDEEYRRLGVGHKLFEAMRAWFKARGMRNIRVSVASENPVSQAFWKGLGFQPFMQRLWYDLS